MKNKKNNYNKITLYEYGNGTYAKPFQERVKAQLHEIKRKYNIIEVVRHDFIKSHYIGKNCMGMDVYKDDELIIEFLVEPKM